MKQIELTVLAKDVDKVIEFLGRGAFMQFTEEDLIDYEKSPRAQDETISRQIKKHLENVRAAALYLGAGLPNEPEETTRLPGAAEETKLEEICADIALINDKEHEEILEKTKLENTLTESKAFANLNAPFKDLDQLSYLTLRIGRLDPRGQTEVKKSLADRAVLIHLGEDRILAAASRKGRFALDSELKKYSFIPIIIPEEFRGIPDELIFSLENRLNGVEQELKQIEEQKKRLRERYGQDLWDLAAAYIMASVIEELKKKLMTTQNIFFLFGWVPAETVGYLSSELSTVTEGRIGIRTFVPEELEKVKRKEEKVPVSLQHGAFVKGFERLVFSYGAPLYGTIDPTPFVAFFFTILFGIMFGDLGQGFILFLLGFLSSAKGVKYMAKFRVYSTPLIAVGIASMCMGLLTGSVFANEEILAKPAQSILGFFMRLMGKTGEAPDRILHLMPDADNIHKLFYFFGFTVGLGVIFNSIGLWVNVINQMILKRYEKAIFSKTGIAGILLFWYALFIGIRCVIGGGAFAWFDLAGVSIPMICIFFGPVIWRTISGKRPLLEEGLMVFIMEGFVEILETTSTYISNTVSFLRVGAFALSHAVLSFIVFTLSEMVSHLIAGPVFSLIIMIAGNTIIILLEGMIVAIQVVRLQYYEFFSKFFTETGVEFTPFRFRGKDVSAEFQGPPLPLASESSK
jgi:V/A-type H+-transporting ATPase subunit I